RCTPARCKASITLTTVSYFTLRSAEMTTATLPVGWPDWACSTAGAMSPRFMAWVLSPALTSRFSSLPTSTWITLSGCLRDALPTLGRSIMLGVISGAVTMKMISRTSITSMNGTMLISFIVRRPRPRCATEGISEAGRRGAQGAQVALQDVGELLDEGLHVDGDSVDVARIAVVGDYRGDGREQAQRGGDRRL